MSNERKLEENKALVRRFLTALSGYDLDAVDEYLAADMVYSAASGEDQDREAFRANIRRSREALSDWSIEMEAMGAEGDLVFGRHTSTFRQTGEWQGVPATGKRVSVKANVLYRVSDGKITEMRSEFDQQAIRQQITGQPA